MIKLLLLSVGIFLILEGLLYFFLAGNLKSFLDQISKVDPQKIKTISLFMVLIGACLIYIIFRFYES